MVGGAVVITVLDGYQYAAWQLWYQQVIQQVGHVSYRIDGDFSLPAIAEAITHTSGFPSLAAAAPTPTTALAVAMVPMLSRVLRRR